MRMLVRCGVVAGALVVACGGDKNPGSQSGTTEDTGPPGPPDFAELGPLDGPAGEGSFRFGAASAAAQIEDRNEHTDWWWFTLPVADGGVGKGTPVGDAARGFSLALDDVAIMQELGLDSYRFSMSWARIEPTRNAVDESALQHYSDFIDALIDAGIRPMVTVHHFSNPVWIDDPRDKDCTMGPTDTNLCGFGHPMGASLVIEEMREHARLLAERFGDRVDDWATINEPVNYMMAGHGVGVFPPGKQGVFDFEGALIPAIKNYLLGHAAMYHAIKDADDGDADGDGQAASVGITLNVVDWVPARDNALSDDPVDLAARDRLEYAYSYLVPETLRTGGWDADFDGEVDEQIDEVADTLDFLGVQYYLRAGVTGEPGIVPLLEATPCFDTLDLGACLPALDETYCVPFHLPVAAPPARCSSAVAGDCSLYVVPAQSDDPLTATQRRPPCAAHSSW